MHRTVSPRAKRGNPDDLPARIPVGISACLLGQPVRYDGLSKGHDYLINTLGHYVDFHPVCPEVAIGLGVPRPPIELVQVQGSIAVRGVDNPALDVTTQLQAFGVETAANLSGCAGFIFKARSPSCGLAGVPVRHTDQPRQAGTGAFAAALTRVLPLLPVAEEDDIDNPDRRRVFLLRLYTHARWQQLLRRELTMDSLQDFHARHRSLLYRHDPRACVGLDECLAKPGRNAINSLADRYIVTVMAVLGQLPERNVDARAVFQPYPEGLDTSR